MKQVRDNVKQANNVLKEFKGARFQVVSFSKPFNNLEVSLDFLDSRRIVFLIFTNCTYYKGSLSISDSSLKIFENNHIFEIKDSKSDLCIKVTGGFILKEGLDSEFFNDFKLPPIPDLPWENESSSSSTDGASEK